MEPGHFHYPGKSRWPNVSESKSIRRKIVDDREFYNELYTLDHRTGVNVS